jgi:hypothetical protein
MSRLTVENPVRAEGPATHALVLRAPASTLPALVLQAAPAQTSDLLRLLEANGSVVGGVDAKGTPFGSLGPLRVDTFDSQAERAACLQIALEVLTSEREWSGSHAAVARVIAERIALRGGDGLRL